MRLDFSAPPRHGSDEVSVPDTIRCPTCRRATPWAGNPLRPFCSERCKLTDLGNWASERYGIPGERVLPEEQEEEEDEE